MTSPTNPIPALLTRMSILPSFFSTVLTACSMESDCVTSHLRNHALPSAQRISSAVRSPASSSSAIQTAAPARANTDAIASDSRAGTGNYRGFYHLKKMSAPCSPLSFCYTCTKIGSSQYASVIPDFNPCSKSVRRMHIHVQIPSYGDGQTGVSPSRLKILRRPCARRLRENCCTTKYQGKSIAVAAGSRCITNLALVTRTAVDTSAISVHSRSSFRHGITAAGPKRTETDPR